MAQRWSMRMALCCRATICMSYLSRQITKLRLSGDWSSAEVDDVLTTPGDRTFTTAKIARGQLLVVDSKFGFPIAAAVAEDRVVPIDLF